jgi:HK97 family phage major capsid protein
MEKTAMADPTMQDVMEAFRALQTEVKERSPDKAKIDEINDLLNKQEVKNQELVTAQKASEKAAEEYKSRIDALELELSRGVSGKGKSYKDSVEYKALEKYVKSGEADIKTLRSDSDAQGGFLAVPEQDNVITKKITELSAIRSIARVRTVSARALVMAKRSSIPTAAYEGQLETGSDSNSAYESDTITPYRLTFSTAISRDLLMDSAFNMESEIMGDAAEAFAVAEGTGFVLGTGVKQPEGFLTNATLIAAARTSSTSGAIDAADVIQLTGDLKVGYNPVYVMNRSTLAYLRTLTDTVGGFLWQPGMDGAVANTINGFQYVLAPDMPAVAANAYSIAFGDFMRGYRIIDRTGLAIVRDELSLKKQAAVEFTLMKWNTGQVVVPEAIKLLKVKA